MFCATTGGKKEETKHSGFDFLLNILSLGRRGCARRSAPNEEHCDILGLKVCVPKYQNLQKPAVQDEEELRRKHKVARGQSAESCDVKLARR